MGPSPGHTTMASHGVPTDLSELERELSRDSISSRLLEAYYQACLGAKKLDRAEATLGMLQQRHPGDHSIRRLRIAISLQRKDYPAAMGIIETLVAFSTPDDALIDSALSVRRLLEPLTLDRETVPTTSVSLCMIVKNEQAYLGPCLNSIKSLVDEVIVLDTGSDDRSADIARIFGAVVHEFAWCDDFSAARNTAVEKARGDWILILDADEIIAPDDQQSLRTLIDRSDPRAEAYSFVTRNYTHCANSLQWQVNDRRYPQHEAGIGWFPTSKVRLFPRSHDIRFEYPVHELVDRSVETAGISIAPCPVPIHHYGHLNEDRNQRKAKKYFDLGYNKLAQLGDDLSAIRELAVQAGQLDYWSQAIELWNRFLAVCPDNDEALANLGGAYWQIDEYEKGAAYSQRAIQRNSGMKEAHYNLAVNLLMQGRPEAALERFQRILQKHPQYTAARFMLAVTLSVSGEEEQGRSNFNILEQELPDQVLGMAVADLVHKLNGQGLSRYAALLESATGRSSCF